MADQLTSPPQQTESSSPNTSIPIDGISQNFPNIPAPSIASAEPDPAAISDDLSPRQLSAIDLMLTGTTDVKIAEILQVDRRTLYNWRIRNPRFRQLLHERRTDLFNAHIDRFLASLSQSIESLTKQAANAYAPTSHRATRTILLASRLGQHLYNLANPKPPTTNNQPQTTNIDAPAHKA